MTSDRCAELISLAVINKMGMVVISTTPMIMLSILYTSFPLVFNWYASTSSLLLTELQRGRETKRLMPVLSSDLYSRWRIPCSVEKPV
jgi:hypothetical protein